MRISVRLVVNLVANGISTEEILAEYRALEAEDIREAPQYVSALANDELHAFPGTAA